MVKRLFFLPILVNELPNLYSDDNLQLMPNIDLLVVDEAHHITADSYIKIIKQVITNNRSAKIFGLTATPTRGDKHNIGVVFSNCADQITLTELINSGHLVRPITYRIDTGETEEKLQALRVKATGDYSDQEMSEILNIAKPL
jgi:DNA repair protein RadD